MRAQQEVRIVTGGAGCWLPKVTLECRPLKSHASQRLAQYHCGLHSTIVANAAYHVHMPELVRQAKAAIDSGETELGCRCRQGRHRSVATAFLLGQCLTHIGFHVSTRHLQQHTWPCDSSCSDCNTTLATVSRRQAVQHVIHLWHSA